MTSPLSLRHPLQRFLLISMFASLKVFDCAPAAEPNLDARVEHGYATNNGVRIHFASLGMGPLILMVHGFPDYWFTWRYQMDALATDHQVVALDRTMKMWLAR